MQFYQQKKKDEESEFPFNFPQKWADNIFKMASLSGIRSIISIYVKLKYLDRTIIFTELTSSYMIYIKYMNYIYVCMCVYVCVCVYVRVCVCVCVRVWVFMCVCLWVCMFVCVWACVCEFFYCQYKYKTYDLHLISNCTIFFISIVRMFMRCESIGVFKGLFYFNYLI